jgi:predicted Fe-Mo cluster-binding NifX family protein
MKIAIPTNDGFTIHKQFANARAFLVSTIQFGEVAKQEMLRNSDLSGLAGEDRSYEELADCDKVIVREIGSELEKSMKLFKVDVVKTEETIITKVLMKYLQTVMQKESDTCCCP